MKKVDQKLFKCVFCEELLEMMNLSNGWGLIMHLMGVKYFEQVCCFKK